MASLNEKFVSQVAAKRAVRVVAVANLDLTGAETIDGVALSTGDRVLATAQTAPEENGIYIANTAGAWTRAKDANSAAEFVTGMGIYVVAGTTYAESVWYFETLGAITLDTTALSFVQLSTGGGGGVTSVNGDSGPAVTLDAEDIPFDNGPSGLTATDVQDAIDEVYAAIPVVPNQIAKKAVNVVSYANLDLNGAETIDGVVLATGDRVLATNQSSAVANGIYVVNTAGAWTRATDADASADFTQGFQVYVFEGSQGAGSLWVNNFDPSLTFTLDTSSVLFTQINHRPGRESYALDGTDISNQYVDLPHLAFEDSVQLYVRGGGLMEFSVDYSLSPVGGVTRLSFQGDLATGGDAALISGDTIQVTYLY